MPTDEPVCPCHAWTCVDTTSLACVAVGAHHPLCGRGPVPAGDDLIGRLMEKVAALEAEVNRLKPAAAALAWIDASRPLISPACDGWAVMPRGSSEVHTGATLAEAVTKAMAAEAKGGDR